MVRLNRAWLFGIVLVPVLSTGGTGISLYGQAQVEGRSADGVWQFVTQRPAAVRTRIDIVGTPTMATFSKDAFDTVAQRLPTSRAARDSTFVVDLPMPDGRLQSFLARESAVLAPELAATFPDIKTYSAQGVTDPTATARFGWTQDGFHAIVLSESGTTYIDPYERGNRSLHVVFRKQDHWHQGDAVRCLVGMGMAAEYVDAPMRANNEFPFTHGTALRVYRLALAATGEYTAAAGGTKPAALARMVATINRVNSVYERDLSVRLELSTGLFGNPTALIYTDGSSDPYSNFDGSAMLDQNRDNINRVVGVSNYDIGHVFGTGGGGIAQLQSVCTSNKARGVTGLNNPTGDAFDIDYVAHEIGHQFGGNHTFNADSSSCSGNRSPSHAYEVGSGSTIQSYSGICSPENLQRNSDDYFHVESLDEMTAFLTSGGGATCGTVVPVGNVPPAVTTPSGFTIPARTPFVLAAAGSDANGDTVTYTWEQFDLGAATSSALSAGSDRGEGPLFRSRPPSTSPIRSFPSMTYVLQNGNIPPLTYSCSGSTCITGEALADTSRTMRFQVTVRDNHAGGGGVATAWTDITTVAAAGPFQVTSPNMAVSVTGGSSLAVNWDVNGTHLTPIGASHVEISLSTDGGATFSTVLAASEANDGSATVTIPNTPTSGARIRIGAVGNIFFDVSDNNFTITAGATPTPTPSTCPGSAPVSNWLCVNGGWVPPDHPLAIGTPTPTLPTPSPMPTPTSGACVGTAPVSGWVCVGNGWVPPDHPLAVGAPTPTPTPTPTPGTCIGTAPVPGWVCTSSGGWVPPNHPLAGSRRSG